MNSVRPVFCVVRETGVVDKYYHEVGREMLRSVVMETADQLEFEPEIEEDVCTHP